LINYHLIIVFKASAGCPPGSSFSRTVRQHTQRAEHGRAASQLSRFHHSGPVTSKFAEYKPNGLLRVGCNVGGLEQSRKQSPKSRKRFRLSAATCHKDRSTRLWKTYQS